LENVNKHVLTSFIKKNSHGFSVQMEPLCIKIKCNIKIIKEIKYPLNSYTYELKKCDFLFSPKKTRETST